MQSALRFLIFIFTVFVSTQTYANTPGMTFKRNTAIILFSSIGGAVLGLSTLSFYGEPENHLGNITTGAALGAVLGSAYVFSRPSPNQNRVQEISHDLHRRNFGKPIAQNILPIQLFFEF